MDYPGICWVMDYPGILQVMHHPGILQVMHHPGICWVYLPGICWGYLPGIYPGTPSWYTPSSRVHPVHTSVSVWSCRGAQQCGVEERRGPGLRGGEIPWVRASHEPPSPKGVTVGVQSVRGSLVLNGENR